MAEPPRLVVYMDPSFQDIDWGANAILVSRSCLVRLALFRVEPLAGPM